MDSDPPAPSGRRGAGAVVAVTAAVTAALTTVLLVGGYVVVTRPRDRPPPTDPRLPDAIVFVQPQATPDEVDALRARLSDLGDVEHVWFVGHDDALAELRCMFADDAAALDSLSSGSVLPVSFRVHTPADDQTLDAQLAPVRGDPAVRDVVTETDGNRRDIEQCPGPYGTQIR